LHFAKLIDACGSPSSRTVILENLRQINYKCLRQRPSSSL